jgi:7,8-dihydropterin-6-yl-methyl-4-(beta-D-ribofuranosyl)aminobenzene 5'-phosphate synthase
MRVTSLIENAIDGDRDDLVCEFGLSLHIETGSLRILFDTGASGRFADNVRVLGIDLAAVDLAVLSHQHFDHGGGLERFFELNPTAPVYLRDCPVVDRYFKALAVIRRPIGLDRRLVERHRDRFRFMTGNTEIAPGVWLLTEIGADHPRPKGNRKLFAQEGDTLVHDAFDHESVLAIRENNGIAVFSGCSHSGIVNMIDAAVDHFPGEPVKAVFGGFHLIGLPQLNTMSGTRDEVETIGRQVLDRVTGTVYTGHCTGQKGFGVLGGVMGDRLRSFSTGARVEV